MPSASSGSSPPARISLEQAARLKHDLGKYVAWMSANLDPEIWQAPGVDPRLVDALQHDLLYTRSCGGRTETAWEVWEREAADLRPLLEPELQQVDQLVAVLRQYEPALRACDGSILGEGRFEIRRAQVNLREALRQLHRRLLDQGK